MSETNGRADREQRIRAKARADFALEKVNQLVTNRLNEVGGATQVTLPPAQVTIPPTRVENVVHVAPTPVQNIVEAPVVQVTVDLAELTKLLGGVFAGLAARDIQLVEELREKNEMLSQLLQVLSSQPAPVVKTRVDVPPAPSPAIAAPPPRPKALRLEEDAAGVKRLIPEY